MKFHWLLKTNFESTELFVHLNLHIPFTPVRWRHEIFPKYSVVPTLGRNKCAHLQTGHMICMKFSGYVQKMLPFTDMVYSEINKVSFKHFKTCPGTNLVHISIFKIRCLFKIQISLFKIINKDIFIKMYLYWSINGNVSVWVFSHLMHKSATEIQISLFKI